MHKHLEVGKRNVEHLFQFRENIIFFFDLFEILKCYFLRGERWGDEPFKQPVSKKTLS